MHMLTAPLDRNGHGMPIPALDFASGESKLSAAGASVTFAAHDEERVVCISSTGAIKLGTISGVYLPAESPFFIVVGAGETIVAAATDGDATISVVPLI